MKPLLRENSPRSLTIHVGTYNVSNEGKLPKAIAEAITKLAVSFLNNSHNVTISNIITQNDRWNAKVDEVNKRLAEQC